MDIKNATVLITGSNRGIGRALVEGFLAAGAKRIYAAARRWAELDSVVALDAKRGNPTVPGCNTAGAGSCGSGASF